MAKSKAQTHQIKGQQQSYSWLGTGIFLCRIWWIKPGFKAIWTSHLQYSCNTENKHIENQRIKVVDLQMYRHVGVEFSFV